MLEGVPVGGGSVCLIQNLEFKIQNYRLLRRDKSRDTFSNLEEEVYKKEQRTKRRKIDKEWEK